jgi:hypothetical protein
MEEFPQLVERQSDATDQASSADNAVGADPGD